MKKWEYTGKSGQQTGVPEPEKIIKILLSNRGITGKKDITEFLHPKDPFDLSAADVSINVHPLAAALARIRKAVKDHESVVVYADYDADGITAGTIMWEALHSLGANVMPYIPHRVEEGYGLSVQGIDAVKSQYNPTLIVTVDHGITAAAKVEYAKELGIDVIVTDHHSRPETVPDCIIVHTTSLCGAGVSWFVAKELTGIKNQESVALACIGTIADLVPLTGANRSIVKAGLSAINTTNRVGLKALIAEAGLTEGSIRTYDISHMLAPRLNAMGRLEHAMDALRLLCTGQESKALLLSRKLGETNKERQNMTTDTSIHAKLAVEQTIQAGGRKKLLFVAEESYNQGIIGLVAGKLVEEYYLPAIVLSKGEKISKASARSISGFNIVEAIRACADLLIDVGGHPMAAGFTVETKNLELLQTKLEGIAENLIDEGMLQRTLRVDMDMPLSGVTADLWRAIGEFEPFGFGNTEPVFVTHGIQVADSRLVGKEGKHLKLNVRQDHIRVDAIAFGFGSFQSELRKDTSVDIAYSIDMNEWNGRRNLQLKVKDIRVAG